VDAVNAIVKRVERALGIPGLAFALASKVAPSDLQSLLMEVHRIRAQRKTPLDVLSDYQTNRFVRPSILSARSFLDWNRVAVSHLPASFEMLELSPVCPLGTCSVVAGVTQDWALGTVRNTEVVSDPTNALALEAAVRRRALLKEDSKSRIAVHLATSHRVVRAQKYEDPMSLSHFRLFALCSAGRSGGAAHDFEGETLTMHMKFYLDSLRAFLGEAMSLRLSCSYFGLHPSGVERVKRLMNDIHRDYLELECVYDPERRTGSSYYKGARFQICARLPDGDHANLVDGGVVDWMSRLMSMEKEKLIISGVGVDRLCLLSSRAL
jgi:hypothetical protein